jgi:hypothetical protein
MKTMINNTDRKCGSIGNSVLRLEIVEIVGTPLTVDWDWDGPMY